LIEDGEVWMEMITSRNQASHTYNQATANEISAKACHQYFPLFEKFKAKMLSLK